MDTFHRQSTVTVVVCPQYTVKMFAQEIKYIFVMPNKCFIIALEPTNSFILLIDNLKVYVCLTEINASSFSFYLYLIHII